MFHFSCTWKGQGCLDSVHETLTDMGVCYTFRHDDMFIEQSGIDPIRFKDPFDEANFYHPRMRVGNVSGHVCLSVCLSVCLCFCLFRV